MKTIFIILLILMNFPVKTLADARIKDINDIKSVVLKHSQSWEYGKAIDMKESMSENIGHKGIIHGKLYVSTAEQLVKWTEARKDIKVTDPVDYQIEVVDLYRDAALVKAESKVSVDYLHLGRTSTGWVIMNYLYQLKNEPKQNK
jgi:hypothetical protein